MGCFLDVGLKIQSLELVKYAVISYFNFFCDRDLLKKCVSTKCKSRRTNMESFVKFPNFIKKPIKKDG